MKGCHIERKNQPGNMIIGHNTSQAMGIGVLDTFMPHPGVIPGPGGSKNGCFGGKKSAKMTRCHGCHVRGNIQPRNWIMGQNTPQAMRIDDPGGIPVSGVSKNDYFCVKKTAEMTGCHVERKITTWKLDNGP